jgi:hypothetical protein
MNRSYLNQYLLMLKFGPSKSKFRLRTIPVGIAFLCLFAAFLTLPAAAQTFTLVADPLSPDAVPPGGTSSANITVGTPDGFSGTVNLGCQVSPILTDGPSCTVSPTSVTTPASASATITTQSGTPTVSYSITITGTAPSTGQTASTEAESLTVLAVTPQFTITVQKAVVPSSVAAGSGGEGTIIVNPINGYQSPGYPQEGVTFSCATMTPLVTIPPVCSFSYPNGLTSLPVNGFPVTSTITISTFGPVTTGSIARPRGFSALWLPVPMLALVGIGAAVGGKRSRKAWGLLALFVMSGALFLSPACGNSAPTTTTPNGVTPNNSYSFTVTGVDADGVSSSNTGSTTSAGPTVSLTVNTPTTQ